MVSKCLSSGSGTSSICPAESLNSRGTDHSPVFLRVRIFTSSTIPPLAREADVSTT